MESHLLQMRGLKPLYKAICLSFITSHLLQMRGLKLVGPQEDMPFDSRIFYRCVD